MAKKMLGKVVAGAALGGASLLVFAPGVAFADGQPHEDEGKVFAKPHAAKPGEEIKLVEVCPSPQENPFVWSKVTGKVKLEPARDGGQWGGDRGGWNREEGSYEHGGDRRDWQDDKSWDKGKDDKGKDWEGGDDRGEWQGRDEAPQYGSGGGAAADDQQDWKSDEHGQDAERGRDSEGGKDREEWQGREGEESKGGWQGRDEYGSDSGEWSGERDWAGEREWAGEESAERGKDGDWEHKKDFVYYGEARIARDAKPGTYKLEGSCGVGELVVLPHGGVDGGDGGMTAGADRGMATAGAGLVGAAALGGLVLLRRRRVDEFAA
ncbi:hypothetical protein [Micromonospora radicis]|uniref:LPXTG cell wall anchor domain-containing protein n=1 Tax=Micromonospora radicis TaxID=1894971 RepID=A0A418MRM2_9ACTN|nr:hypothetical protein [Micromonospora radicis]RIV36578.1 hypothetical protein D2L64_19110 [Micromonospora radicis]